MKYPPVVKDYWKSLASQRTSGFTTYVRNFGILTKHSPWLKLEPKLILFTFQYLIPFPCRLVPRIDVDIRGDDASVVVVPPDPMQVAALGFNHGICHIWCNCNALVAASVPWQLDFAQYFKILWKLLLKSLGGMESIYEQRLPA